MTSFDAPRRVDAADVALPPGYQIEAVATGLTFPTGVAFDARGGPHVTESGYAYGEVFLTPRLVRIGPDGTLTTVAEGGRNGPWNGLVFADGRFYVAEGGQLEGGRLLRITPDGPMTTILDGLPSRGDHHTNGPAVGPDGWIYFGQGTATNSAVVGPENAEFGWLRRFPDVHDIPCETVTLSDRTYTSENPLTPDDEDRTTTGAFAAFGTVSGPTVEGVVPCNGAVMRVRPDGSDIQLVAWGFRNPFGLAFAPDGRLFVTDNSYDDRGSRPAWGTGDYLWAVEEGTWYGWPDFAGGVPFAGERFGPPGGEAPQSVLSETPGEPPHAVATFGVHSSSNGLDFSRSSAFGHEGEAFVAQFGDMAPGVGKTLHPVGFQVVRVDVETGSVQPFALNRSGRGPASGEGGGGLERPVAVRFGPDGHSLYVVDFGVMTIGEQGPEPRPGTGVLWRIWRE
jgi:glucose/arabinose dehydrogenase